MAHLFITCRSRKRIFAIVDATRRVAQTMNLKTVAEFVESEEILEILADMGVN